MLANIFRGINKDPATCEVCGNEYNKAFEVRMGGKTHTFDSFECAIHALAPTCAHCGCRIIGHGVEAGSMMYCCAYCASQQGVHIVLDHGIPAKEQMRG